MNRRNIKLTLICLTLGIFILSTSNTLAATKVYRYNQDATAYNTTGKPTESGKWPKISYCAVHKKNGEEIIPFGTVLYFIEVQTDTYTDTTFHSPEGELTYVRVEDTGDPNWVYSEYWIDLFFGDYITEANQFGESTVSYWYYQ